MNPISFGLSAMPPDVVDTILAQLDTDASMPAFVSAARWSRSSHACHAQLRDWMRANADPDRELCKRLPPAMAYGQPLLRPWLVARPFLQALSAAHAVARINEQVARLNLDPRCAALLVLACERRQLGVELSVIVADYLRRQELITAADPGEIAAHPAHHSAADGAARAAPHAAAAAATATHAVALSHPQPQPLMPTNSPACQLASLLVLNAADFIIAGKFNAEGAAHAVVRALTELPLEARVAGLGTLVGIYTSVDQALFMEALQPRLSLLLPSHWDPAFMQSDHGVILLAALREMSTKRFASVAAVAIPAIRFLGKWLQQLPQGACHVAEIERTPHHWAVMMTLQSLFWMARDNAPSVRFFVQEFVARGFITPEEFAVLQRQPELARSTVRICFNQLKDLLAKEPVYAETPEPTRPNACALV